MRYQTLDMMMATLGENIREARLADNLSQQTAAERSGVSMTALRNLEAGRNASVATLLSVCRTLNRTDWIEHLAPPEISDALFERPDPDRKRLRASPCRVKKDATK